MIVFRVPLMVCKSPACVIAREHSDRSNPTVLRNLKYDEIAALPLVARNDDRDAGGLASDVHAHGRAAVTGKIFGCIDAEKELT